MSNHIIQIISGTNRPNSNTRKVVENIHSLYQQMSIEVGIIDLQDFPLLELNGTQYFGEKPVGILQLTEKVLHASGLVIVTPEYNGGFPGVLKLFIDHMKFPESFEFRPVCFVGLGAGMWGGLRAVEQLQQIFAYRNAFGFPLRVFMKHVNTLFTDRTLEEKTRSRLQKQAEDFLRFVKALQEAGLDANTKLQT